MSWPGTHFTDRDQQGTDISTLIYNPAAEAPVKYKCDLIQQTDTLPKVKTSFTKISAAMGPFTIMD